ncbi:hypothetical protein [Actinacidiphila sp. ITFR-21]|uniref:hypothetical protein n=1 Tax=Actinacidiphila sp. ITFR-21 TaxID=3075199 RepID=UPI002889BC7A|nr:hypothetical protein [Streptomyces sp. ITFR-21]WNI18629.1 hypothetical protein RLT57_25920 [Streptomyces sp. ITFR-21]
MPPAVAAVLGDDGTAGPSWTELAHGGLNQATGGVWRVAGPGGSAVVKLCVPGGPGPWASSPDPRHWNHWRREPLAYADGLTTSAFAAAGIDSPRQLAQVERPDHSFVLWLEDVAGLPGAHWPVPRLAAFAHALGAAQARWTDRLPERPWLSRGRLRQYVASKSLPAAIPWDHPAVVAFWSAPLRTALRRMWEQRDALLSAAESGPRTLCHLMSGRSICWPSTPLRAARPAVHQAARPVRRPPAFPATGPSFSTGRSSTASARTSPTSSRTASPTV